MSEGQGEGSGSSRVLSGPQGRIQLGTRKCFEWEPCRKKSWLGFRPQPCLGAKSRDSSFQQLHLCRTPAILDKVTWHRDNFSISQVGLIMFQSTG